MYDEPAVGGLEAEASASIPQYDCRSCTLCLACLITPTPDIDLISIQHLWHINEPSDLA